MTGAYSKSTNLTTPKKLFTGQKYLQTKVNFIEGIKLSQSDDYNKVATELTDP